jgi:hypothetical protein
MSPRNTRKKRNEEPAEHAEDAEGVPAKDANGRGTLECASQRLADWLQLQSGCQARLAEMWGSSGGSGQG